jgi:deoxyribonuclease V
VRLRSLHPWDLTPAAAIALQRDLAPQVIREGDPKGVRLIAAADVAYVERALAWAASTARAAVVLMQWTPDSGGQALSPTGDAGGRLHLVEHHVIESPVAFPYVPGLLSFREIPALARALERLSAEPDLLLVDGQGIAHPRRFGIASHLGLLAGLPTIGCAKSRLFGEAPDPAPERGATSDLADASEVIGRLVRTKANVKPLYVSVGHMISLDPAVAWTLRLAPSHRLPEPARLADHLSKGNPLPGAYSQT